MPTNIRRLVDNTVLPALALMCVAAVWSAILINNRPKSALMGATQQPTERGEYRADVLSVHDGDTITADIELGLGVWLRSQSIRLIGVDTPELNGPDRGNALLARDYVANQIKGQTVLLQTSRRERDKYGRILATVITPSGAILNDELLKRGLARPLVYGSLDDSEEER